MLRIKIVSTKGGGANTALAAKLGGALADLDGADFLISLVPPELLSCRTLGMHMEDMFPIRNSASDPRPGSDGLCSHGSDEREMAWAYFARCGFGSVDG